MEHEWLETTATYRKSHSRFYLYLLYPIVLLLIALFLFLFFFSKEVVIRTSGVISSENIQKVQVPYDQTIKENFLVENKEVKKGDVLFTLDGGDLTNRADSLKEDIDRSEKQKKALDTYKSSINDNENHFDQDAEDTFGYNHGMKEYLSQRESLNDTINAQETNKSNTTGSYNKQIGQAQQTQGADVSSLEQAKQSALNEAEQQIASARSQISSLKERKLSEIESSKKDIDKELSKNKADLKEMESQLDGYTVKAKTNGVIHLDEAYKNVHKLPQGTIIAEIYPKIATKGKDMFEVSANIPANEISNIKKDMTFRYKIDRKGVSEQSFTGKITQIAQTSSQSKKGEMYYPIKGELKLSPKEAKRVKYGMSGDMRVIVGKKTYFNYLKDMFWND